MLDFLDELFGGMDFLAEILDEKNLWKLGAALGVLAAGLALVVLLVASSFQTAESAVIFGQRFPCQEVVSETGSSGLGIPGFVGELNRAKGECTKNSIKGFVQKAAVFMMVMSLGWAALWIWHGKNQKQTEEIASQDQPATTEPAQPPPAEQPTEPNPGEPDSE